MTKDQKMSAQEAKEEIGKSYFDSDPTKNKK